MTKASAFSVQAFLPLSPQVFYIMLALADDERHGYAILLEVEQVTQGAVRLGPGTLYGSLKRLLHRGLVVESDRRPDEALDDERRRYYRLTELGRRVLSAESVRLAGQVELARRKRILPRARPA